MKGGEQGRYRIVERMGRGEDDTYLGFLLVHLGLVFQHFFLGGLRAEFMPGLGLKEIVDASHIIVPVPTLLDGSAGHRFGGRRGRAHAFWGV